jgi:hypothetical protein
LGGAPNGLDGLATMVRLARTRPAHVRSPVPDRMGAGAGAVPDDQCPVLA